MTLRLLTVFAFVATLVTGTSTAAHACKCVDMTPAEAVGHADVVFTGTVIAGRVDDSRPSNPRSTAAYTFRADNVYKGAPADEFTLATTVDSASCGYSFDKGTRYLVFANSSASLPGVSLSSSACAGNMPIGTGTGPLQSGDERTPGQPALAGRVNADMIAALGSPTAVSVISPRSPQSQSVQSAAGSLGWHWLAGGVTVVAFALILGLALVERRRRLARRG